MRLPGKVAIVTGGVGGMDATPAKLFAREDVRVTVVDSREWAVDYRQSRRGSPLSARRCRGELRKDC